MNPSYQRKKEIMTGYSNFVPLRDEDTISRSMSINERIFLRSCAHACSTSSILRLDGRKAGESRPVRFHFSRSHNWSECTVYAESSTSTQVTCFVSGEAIPCPRPYDRPNDGIIVFQVEANPMACMGWEPSSVSSTEMEANYTAKQFTNRILRNLERNILLGDVLDVESLCIVSGQWVWKLIVSLTIVDHGGNCLDVAMMAAMAALRHYRRPHVDVIQVGGEENKTGTGAASVSIIHSDDREPTPLPIHHTPLLVSFALFSDPTASSSTIAALLDPNVREEMVQDGTVTLGYNKYGELTCLDFPGGCEMHPRQMMACAELGKKKCIELCNLFEEALQGAEETAEKDRIQSLRQRIYEKQEAMDYPSMMETELMESVDSYPNRTQDIYREKTSTEDQEEELYRLQALDYSIGHVAVKVKDNMPKKVTDHKGGTLLEAMIQSASLSSKAT